MRAEGFDSYYSVLGIRHDASDMEIRKAYRQAAIKNHPDKGGDAAAFKACAEAYQVLSDADSRAVYDRYGKAGLRSGGGAAERTWAPGASPEAVFRQMFGDHADLAALFRELDLAAARGPTHRPAGPHAPREPPHQPRRLLSRTPLPHSASELERLTARLRAELLQADGAHPLPLGAAQWSARELRCYLERGGGTWTPARLMTGDGLRRLGASSPVRPMALWTRPSRSTMLSVLEASDEAALSDLAKRLAADNAVALPLGLDAALLVKAQSEARSIAGDMQPAMMPSNGEARGDEFVRLSQCFRAATAGLPVLQGLREALSAVGAALAPLILADVSLGSLQLAETSDAFIARVPAGRTVVTHLDSECTDRAAPLERKLSLSVSLSDEEGLEGGAGARVLFDDATDSWMAGPTQPGTLLIELSDRCVHRAPPAEKERLSASVYLLGGYVHPDGAAAESMPSPGAAGSASSFGLPSRHHAAPAARVDCSQSVQSSHQRTRTVAQPVMPEEDDASTDSDAEEGAMDELG
jgi:curved DNA-binding protein CbpA